MPAHSYCKLHPQPNNLCLRPRMPQSLAENKVLYPEPSTLYDAFVISLTCHPRPASIGTFGRRRTPLQDRRGVSKGPTRMAGSHRAKKVARVLVAHPLGTPKTGASGLWFC